MTKTLGKAYVDSGQLLVIDPCYLSDWKDGDYGAGEENDYAKCCNASMSKKLGGEVHNGVVVGSGYGDGEYEVKAEYEKGRVKSITIKFF